jgi:indolepyruvate ferredoxin oxidoreductase
LARENEKGELQKSKFGSWMGLAFRLLAPLKVLRGGTFDVFGRTDERRQERALIQEYQKSIAGMLPLLDASNVGVAIAFARLPEQIRGFGHVKARNLAAVRPQWDSLNAQFYAAKS